MIRKLNIDNGLQDCKTEHQAVTKAKIKRAESADMKGSGINELHCNLKVKCSELPASF